MHRLSESRGNKEIRDVPKIKSFKIKPTLLLLTVSNTTIKSNLIKAFVLVGLQKFIKPLVGYFAQVGYFFWYAAPQNTARNIFDIYWKDNKWSVYSLEVMLTRHFVSEARALRTMGKTMFNWCSTTSYPKFTKVKRFILKYYQVSANTRKYL